MLQRYQILALSTKTYGILIFADEHDPSAVDFSDLSPSAIAQIEEICKKEAARKKREEELCKLAQERETLKQKAADDAEGPLEKRVSVAFYSSSLILSIT